MELTIDDLRREAEHNVQKPFYDHLHSGSWSESTKRSNHEDSQEITFRQKGAVDMSDRTLATTMVGQRCRCR